MTNYPDSWSEILSCFANYGTTFDAFSKSIKPHLKNLTSEQVVELLTPLSNSLGDCATKTKNGLDTLTGFENQFSNVFPSINNSIQEGWDELQDEEAQMIAIVQAITRLQDEIASLQSQIDSSTISGGKSFVQTNVKIAYNILSATGEVAIPYLSIVSLAYTIGKTFYDIISKTDKINKDLVEIGKLQIEASNEAQAAAATKATIQYLYNIEIQFLSLKKHAEGLWMMWKNEKSKIDEAINAINAGAEPSRFLDILRKKVSMSSSSKPCFSEASPPKSPLSIKAVLSFPCTKKTRVAVLPS